MQKSLKALITVGLAAGLSSSLLAADAKWYDKVAITGFADGFYQWNLNGHTPANRVYDATQGQFALEGAQLSVAMPKDANGTSGQVDILYGNEEFAGLAFSGTTLNNFYLSQAFVSQVFGPVSFSLGKQLTFIGNESLYATSDWNFSRSLLFNQEPVYGLGLRANYAPVDGLNILVDWDNGITAAIPNLGAGYGAQIAYTGSALAGINVTLGWYMDDENQTHGVEQNTDYINAILSYTLGDFNFAGEYLYKTIIADANKQGLVDINGMPFSPKLQGYALYVNYNTPWKGFSIVPRFEQVFSPDFIVTGLNDKQEDEVTVSLKYAMGSLTHILEFRDDITPGATFAPAGGSTAASDMKNTQMTVTYAAVVSF